MTPWWFALAALMFGVFCGMCIGGWLRAGKLDELDQTAGDLRRARWNLQVWEQQCMELREALRRAEAAVEYYKSETAS